MGNYFVLKYSGFKYLVPYFDTAIQVLKVNKCLLSTKENC